MKILSIKALVATSLMLAANAATAAGDEAEWSYSGANGPDSWGSLSEAFAACEKGLMQSPVDLGEATTVGEIDVSVDWDAGPLSLFNNGKTVQASFAEGSHMTSGGRVFSLVQVHFHTPSEHTVDGETYPLVAHFVHATDRGELGVLGVLFEEGEANAELQKIIDAADDVGAETEAVTGITLDPNGLLPGDLEVFRYMGSLTTPPCSEGVHWHVVEQTVEASARQISAMAKFMGNNARPVLPLNGRLLVAPE